MTDHHKAAVDGVPPAAAERPSGLEKPPAVTLSSDDRPPQRVQQLDIPDVALHFLKFEAEIDGKKTSCLFDTGAILTVLKRNCFSPPTPPVSKLKLKGVLPGTGKLYGPRIATMKLNSHTYSFPVYEADMEEECIIGLNFIQSFYCVVDPVRLKLRINEPHQTEVSLQKVTKSPSVSFRLGTVYFTLRSSHPMELPPNQSTKISFHFQADVEIASARLPPVSSAVGMMFTSVRRGNKEQRSPERAGVQTCAEEIQLEQPDGRGAKLGTFSPISQVEGGGYSSHHGGISECERTNASEPPSSPQKKGPILTTEEYRPGESPKRYSGTDSRQNEERPMRPQEEHRLGGIRNREKKGESRIPSKGQRAAASTSGAPP